MNGTFLCLVCNKFISGGPKTVESHLNGKKHVALLPLYITVTGSFTGDQVNEINKHFEQFGTIVKHVPRVIENSVSIDYFFLDKKVYTKIIHSEHKVDNKILEVSWTKPNATVVNRVLATPKITTSKPVKQKTQSVQQPSLSPAIKQRNQTVTETVKKSKMGDENSEENKSAIINSVKEGKTFEEQVNILFQKLKGNSTEVDKSRNIIYHDLTNILSGTFPHHEIYFFGSSITGLDYKGSDLDVYVANVRFGNYPDVMTLKKIRLLIYKSKKFCDLLLISQAAVPIIKCIHTKTQICCDLNVKNSLSVANSELIRYYLSINEKIKQLMIVVKFWAECYALKRANFFSGYAIYLLVIFYLQQEPYNLPSVADLQKNVPPNIEDGWNCAFEKLNCSNSSIEKKSLMELVAGFFKFYSHFDYVSYVVCPFLGKPIRKTCFLKPHELPDCFIDYMRRDKDMQMNSSICIQDPFELNRNVSSSMPLMFVGKFSVLCAHVAQEILNCEVELLLYNVLTKFTNVALSVYHFMLENCQGGEDEDSNLAIFESVKELTHKILEKVVCCQVNKIPNTRNDQAVFSCVSKHNVWDDRISILKNLERQLSLDTKDIDREVATTACIVKYFPKAFVANFTVTITLKQKPFCVEFELKSKGKLKSFFHVCHFLKMKVNEWFPMIQEKSDNVNKENQTIKKEAEVATICLADNDVKSEMVTRDVELQDDSNVCANNSVLKPIENADKSSSGNSGIKEEPSDQVDFKCPETKEISIDDSKGNSVEESKPKEEEDTELEEEEDEEDIPPDFFDDFSNQDFMDGLDIVDAWDEESGRPLAELENDYKELKMERKTHSPIRFSSKDSYRKSESRPKRTMDKYDRSKSRSLTRYYKKSNSYSRRPRSRSRFREKVRLSDTRRDPEKTKRDINRDKIKCARDKEQKLVSDKLRLVETGLVPPGTEMDVDISSIMGEKRCSKGNSAEKLKEERERKYSRRSNSREARKSRYSRSPPIYKTKTREPPYRHRRNSSMDSNSSDREMRMRSSRKRTHSSRSRSRDSPCMKSRKHEDKKKKSFLEEIRDKLNEVRPVPVVQYTHPNMQNFQNPMPVPIPAPVPAPNQFFHQNQIAPQYDQSFFIGDSYNLGQTNNMMLNQQPNVCYNNMMGGSTSIPVSHVQITAVSQIAQMQTTSKLSVVQQTASISPKVSLSNEPTLKATEHKQTTDDIDKLFADKKISLSDFLTITAKCEVQSSSPEHLQKKIKVISRCQDAIKAMSDERRFTGRLSVLPSSEAKNKSEVKYQSPLRRIPVVRFQFTTPTKISEDADSFTVALNKVLQKVGVLKDTTDFNDSAEILSNQVNTGSSFADEDTTAITLKASLLNVKGSDFVSCEECNKRKLKTFADVGSQCVDDKETMCVGTQVSEEDLNPSKGFPKNDSIAYLTPAQLLEKEKEVPSSPVKNSENKNLEEAEMHDKPNPSCSTRGGYRNSTRGRQYNNDNFFDRERNFGPPRLGPGIPPVRYFPRHFDNANINQSNIMRINQLRHENGSLFTDFSQPYRGRNPNRFGPRY